MFLSCDYLIVMLTKVGGEWAEYPSLSRVPVVCLVASRPPVPENTTTSTTTTTTATTTAVNVKTAAVYHVIYVKFYSNAKLNIS